MKQTLDRHWASVNRGPDVYLKRRRMFVRNVLKQKPKTRKRLLYRMFNYYIATGHPYGSGFGPTRPIRREAAR